jgi:hypothetical protein
LFFNNLRSEDYKDDGRGPEASKIQSKYEKYSGSPGEEMLRKVHQFGCTFLFID